MHKHISRSLAPMQVRRKQLVFTPRKNKYFAQKIFCRYRLYLHKRKREKWGKNFLHKLSVSNLEEKNICVLFWKVVKLYFKAKKRNTSYEIRRIQKYPEIITIFHLLYVVNIFLDACSKYYCQSKIFMLCCIPKFIPVPMSQVKIKGFVLQKIIKNLSVYISH